MSCRWGIAVTFWSPWFVPSNSFVWNGSMIRLADVGRSVFSMICCGVWVHDFVIRNNCIGGNNVYIHTYLYVYTLPATIQCQVWYRYCMQPLWFLWVIHVAYWSTAVVHCWYSTVGYMLINEDFDKLWNTEKTDLKLKESLFFEYGIHVFIVPLHPWEFYSLYA